MSTDVQSAFQSQGSSKRGDTWNCHPLSEGPFVRTFKVALVGREEVGKTTFIARLFGMKWEEREDWGIKQTRDYVDHELIIQTNYGRILFRIKDCAGDKKFRELRSRIGYPGRDCAVFMYDLPRRGSTENDLVDFWKRVQEAEGNKSCPSVVIGNMRDTLGLKVVRGSKFASDRKLTFYQTSCKDDTQADLRAPFLELARKLTLQPLLTFPNDVSLPLAPLRLFVAPEAPPPPIAKDLKSSFITAPATSCSGTVEESAAPLGTKIRDLCNSAVSAVASLQNSSKRRRELVSPNPGEPEDGIRVYSCTPEKRRKVSRDVKPKESSAPSSSKARLSRIVKMIPLQCKSKLPSNCSTGQSAKVESSPSKAMKRGATPKVGDNQNK